MSKADASQLAVNAWVDLGGALGLVETYSNFVGSLASMLKYSRRWLARSDTTI
jgi:hypothetical protein